MQYPKKDKGITSSPYHDLVACTAKILRMINIITGNMNSDRAIGSFINV